MSKIRVGVIGVGNCFAGLIQGIEYYKRHRKKNPQGLMQKKIGPYNFDDIEFVSAFDVGRNKIGKTLEKAVFASPNLVNWIKLPKSKTIVREAPILDGVGIFVENKIKPIKNPTPLEKLEKEIEAEIKKTRTEVLVNYLPVGSQKATEFWAEMALKTKSAFINCIPVFIASDKKWAEKFKKARVPIIGDDIKGQIGATIVHRVLSRLCDDRGATIDKTYQINVGGNSVTGDQMILLKVNGEIKYESIGKFIDNLIKKYGGERRKDGKEVITRDKISEKIECFTIDDSFKVRLVQVEAFIRHKIDEPIFEIETEGGRKIKITKDHNLFILNETGRLEPLPIKDLKKGESFIAVPENLFSSQKEKNEKVLEILEKEKRESLKEKLIPNLPVLRKKWKIKSTSWWRLPQISAKVVLAQIDKINPDENFKKNIYNLCTGETKFLKVKKIREIKNLKGEYVYDLSVKPYERFICSNILVHNTDFLNMLERNRLESKKISKTEAVKSQIKKKIKTDKIYIGPADFIPFLGNTKLAFIRLEGKMFADIPYSIELRLEVDDKANSAGVVIDAIRCAKLALDKKIGGYLPVSAYFMKRPLVQYSDEEAKKIVEEFVKE